VHDCTRVRQLWRAYTSVLRLFQRSFGQNEVVVFPFRRPAHAVSDLGRDFSGCAVAVGSSGTGCLGTAGSWHRPAAASAGGVR